MQGINHIAGGLAFTGIFASFADVNVFERPEYIAVAVVGSVLADIDHTRSIIGKMFFPVAKWVDRKYGHRTITHSFLFFALISASVGVLEMLFIGSKTLTLLFSLAYFSHLLFDMCTRQGIPFFLPFTRARCVLPGNPNLRLSSKNIAAEAVIFFVFGGLLLTTMPLMAQGFWTTYNKAFATFAHLHREQQSSKDVLRLTTTEGLAGQVVSTTNNGAIIYAGGEFVDLEKGAYTLKDFQHTGKPRSVPRLEFEAISADSMRQLLKLPIVSGLFSATAQISYKENGTRIETNSKKLDYSTAFEFLVIEPDTSSIAAEVVKWQDVILEKQAVLAAWNRQQGMLKAEYEQLQASYNKLSAYEQGKAIDRIEQLAGQLQDAEAPAVKPQIDAALREISRIRKQNSGSDAAFTGYVEIWKQ